MSMYGAAWTASTASRTPLWALTLAAISAIGWMRADLVVREHDRDEDRLVGDRGVELVRVDPAVAVDRQLDDLEAELLEVLERVADGVVLDRRGHDPVAAGLARPGGALEREVVRLGPARGEDDLARLRVQALRDALVGLVERGPGLAPERVGGRRVAELLGEERQHRLERLGAERASWRRGRGRSPSAGIVRRAPGHPRGCEPFARSSGGVGGERDARLGRLLQTS